MVIEKITEELKKLIPEDKSGWRFLARSKDGVSSFITHDGQKYLNFEFVKVLLCHANDCGIEDKRYGEVALDENDEDIIVIECFSENYSALLKQLEELEKSIEEEEENAVQVESPEKVDVCEQA